ncbi:MAG: FprA family A-type flavoprotein [Thermodesulfobacteriota bacterium]
MKPKKIKDGVFWVGAVDWDRRLFDSLIPLPYGTSYNAYLVVGSEKTALLDTVEPSKTEVLLSQLEEVESIDYIVSHHAEQDHSGAIPAVLDRYPEAVVLASTKARALLMDHLRIPEARVRTVADGEKVSLGGKTFEFIYAPWVHWPETMFTYLAEDRVLFTCDLFGSHLAASGVFYEDGWKVREEAKRYYSEVMMPFRSIIARHMDRISGLDMDVIAPSHGPAHGSTGMILEAHREWVSEKVKNKVVVPFASMHGSTEKMVDVLTEELSQRGVVVERFNMAVSDMGELAMSLVDAATIVIGSPTVLLGAHPLVVSAVFMANSLKPKLKFASIIGSYGWGGRMVEQITGLMGNLKVEMIEPVMIKGKPTEDDFAAIAGLAGKIAARHEKSEDVLTGGPVEGAGV